MKTEDNNNQQSPFATDDGSTMFSKRFLIFSAILIFVLLIFAIFVDPEGFREQVNNATFVWDIDKDEK